MPTLVAVITTPPNDDPYALYVGFDDTTIDHMDRIGTVEFDIFDNSTVLKLEDYLGECGYLVEEWRDETPEYRVAAITTIEI